MLKLIVFLSLAIFGICVDPPSSDLLPPNTNEIISEEIPFNNEITSIPDFVQITPKPYTSVEIPVTPKLPSPTVAIPVISTVSQLPKTTVTVPVISVQPLTVTSKPKPTVGIPVTPKPPSPPSTYRSDESFARILKQEQSIDIDGTYQYSYETENGIEAEEVGYPKFLDGNPPEQAEQVQGSFSYTVDGQLITVHYVANEDGFQPTGDHLPTSPPIPEAIQKSLEYIAAHTR